MMVIYHKSFLFILSMMINMNQYLHILMINLPMQPESNILVAFLLDLNKFDVFPTELLD